MGRANAVGVMAQWADLDHGPMRLLVHMALVSLDPPGNGEFGPCLYFAGWDLAALALGYSPPSALASDTFSVRRRDNVYRDVKRMRAPLVSLGAIRLMKPSAPGRPALWWVNTTGDGTAEPI